MKTALHLRTAVVAGVFAFLAGSVSCSSVPPATGDAGAGGTATAGGATAGGAAGGSLSAGGGSAGGRAGGGRTAGGRVAGGSAGGGLAAPDAGVTPEQGLGDAGPACGAADGTCCAAGALPLPWSRPGERCVPGYQCLGTRCRPTEMGKPCVGDSDCPLGRTCISVSDGGVGSDGGVSARVCTAACSAATDCIAGWTCGGQSRVCECTRSSPAEACNASDDDCDGLVDGVAANAACMSGLACCVAACSSLQTSSLHCGGCGRSCGTGTCTNGRCGPEIVSTLSHGIGFPFSSEGGRLFFRSNLSLYHCAGAPCLTPDVVDTLASGSEAFPNVVVDPSRPTRVFYSYVNFNSPAPKDGFLYVAELGMSPVKVLGVTATPTAMVMSRPAPNQPVRLFWGDASGSVRSCLTSACSTTIVTLARGTTGISAIAVDDAEVFFATAAVAEPNLGDVKACPRTGCGLSQPRTIATGEIDVGSIALTPTNVFWASRGTGTSGLDGAIRVCGKASSACSPRSITTVSPPQALQYPECLIADDSTLYVSLLGKGVHTCPVDDCQEMTKIASIAPDTTNSCVTHDGQYLYARDQSNWLRMLKPQ